MEKTLFITKPSQLKYMSSRYARLYYGQEFCERLIPSARDLIKVLSFVKKRRVSFSLVTPYLTDSGLKKLIPLLVLLKNRKIYCEIVINDWGVLNLINRQYPNLSPVLGRLLTKQKRGPQLMRLLRRKTKLHFLKNPQNPKIKYLVFQKKLPLDLDPYYKGSNSSSVPIIHNFLVRQRIQRIELDNVGQGLFLELPKDRVSASLYLPYVCIATTFFCLTAGCDQKEGLLLKRKSCKRQCQRYTFKLRHKTMPKVIYLKGNTQFYKNTQFQFRQWQEMGIDRIVYEPVIPI